MSLVVFIAWGLLIVLALLDGRLGRTPATPLADAAPPPDATDADGPSRRDVLSLAVLAALLAGVRAVLALDRGILDRNVDECQYAVTALFAQHTGESLFGWAWNLSGLHLVYLLNDAARPFAAVDALTSLVVAATGFLLGWAVLRARAGLAASLLTAAFYVVGLAPFEGLGSNKEPWVNLALAAWLLARLGPPGARRQLLAGACLGLAAVLKEQALVFVLAEPLLGALQARSAGDDKRAWARGQAVAAGGFWIVYAGWLLLFVAHGQGGAYVRFLLSWGAAGGTPFADQAALEAAARPSAPLALALGWFPLLLSPVGVLGLVRALRPPQPERPRTALALAAGALLVPAAIASAIGFRFFAHYLMFFLPGLAILAGLRAAELGRELGRPDRRRWLASALLLIALLLGLQQARILTTSPAGRAMATGQAVAGQEALEAVEVALYVAERTPADRPILVWGWRPELYLFAQRLPATRMLGGLSAGMEEAIDDLERWPASAVVVRRGSSAQDQLFRLERHPRLTAWLQQRGYRPVARPGWDVWLPGEAPR